MRKLEDLYQEASQSGDNELAEEYLKAIGLVHRWQYQCQWGATVLHYESSLGRTQLALAYRIALGKVACSAVTTL